MLVGLIGYARSGKDTFADFMVRDYEFTKLAFADPMKEALIRLNPIIRIADNLTLHLSQALTSMGWDDLKTASPDLRPLMQRLGTEVGRDLIGENVWVDLAMKKAAEHEHVVFSDVRFKNEADAIRDAGGVILRITRPNVGPANSHISETELDTYEPTYLVNNSGTMDDLSVKVNVLLSALKAWA